MGRRAINQHQYDLLIEGWRLHPECPTKVARFADVDYRTAKKAWEEGFPRKGYEAISLVFEREQVRARAQLLAEAAAKAAHEEKLRDDASKQAAQARAQEGQMVSIARQSSLAAQTVNANLAQGARALANLVKKRLELEAAVPDGDPKQMTVGQGMYLLQRIADTMAKINSAAHEAMIMERLHLGEPGQVIQLQAVEMSFEEAELKMAAAQQALEHAKRVGGLRVIDGGLAQPQLGKKVGT